MKPKEGDIFISMLDGETFVIQKIVNEMVALKSKDGNRQILTGIENLKLFYKKGGPETNKETERRKKIRCFVQDNVIASLHNGNVMEGKVKDISMGGLSFEHLEPVNKERSTQESLERNLFLVMGKFSLSKVPCKVVYDTPVQLIQSSEYMKFPLNSKTRRCGVQFQALSDDQNRQLKLFLETHTKGILPSSQH